MDTNTTSRHLSHKFAYGILAIVVISVGILIAVAYYKTAHLALTESAAQVPQNDTSVFAVFQSPLTGKSIMLTPQGSFDLTTGKFSTNEKITATAQQLVNNPSAIFAQQVAQLEQADNSYIVIPSEQDSDATVRDRVKKGGGEVRELGSYLGSRAYLVRGPRNTSAKPTLPDTYKVYRNRFSLVKATSPTGSPDVVLANKRTSGVKVGIIDTGVDSQITTEGTNYDPGFDLTSRYILFEPWATTKSYKVNANQGWLDVSIGWSAQFGFAVSPNDLDLYLKNPTGQIVAKSTNTGNIPQSERLQYLVPKQGQYTVEIRLKENVQQPRTHSVVIYPQHVNQIVSMVITTMAGTYPDYVDVMLDGDVTSQPRGALPSLTNHWKKGSFTIHDKTYNVIVSDTLPDATCFTNDQETSQTKVIGQIGYESVSIDINGDGDYSDQKVSSTCAPNNGGYLNGIIELNNISYFIDRLYSMRVEYSFQAEDGRIVPITYRHLTELNDKLLPLRLGNIFPYALGPGSMPDDTLGHGTHVAGIVKSTYPNAQIYNGKVFGGTWAAGISCWSTPEGTFCLTSTFADDFKISQAMEGAIGQGAKVLNLSLGQWYDPPTKCEDLFLSQYVKEVISRGTTVVVAAGNAGTNGIDAPGCVPEAITVGAVTKTNPRLVANYSSRGPTKEGVEKPDLVAIGGDDSQSTILEKVYYFFTNGVTSIESKNLMSYFGVVNQATSGMINMSGTSMATPAVAGVAAKILQDHPTWTPAQVKAELLANAVDLGLPITLQGKGLLKEHADATKITPPPTPSPSISPSPTTPTTSVGTIQGRVVYDRNANGKIDLLETYILTESKNSSACKSYTLVSRFLVHYQSVGGNISGSLPIAQCDPQPFYTVTLPVGTYKIWITMPTGWKETVLGTRNITLTQNGLPSEIFYVDR